MLHAGTLAALIPREAATVGLIVPPFKAAACDCAAMARRLASRLSELLPHLAGHIRLRRTRSSLEAWARLALAPRATICTPSVFCVWPTIASAGHGVVFDSPLWPHAAALASRTLTSMGAKGTWRTPYVERRRSGATRRIGGERLPNLTVVMGGYASSVTENAAIHSSQSWARCAVERMI